MKKVFSVALVLMTLCAAAMALPAYAEQEEHPWTIYFHPGVRFGTDDRTLYIMDFLVPLYQGDKNILFFNPRFTPSDQGGWETNFGFGYRHLLLDDRLILGGNFYYDHRDSGWGTSHEQIGLGIEAMAEINPNLALTARFNYYIPMSDAIIADGIIGIPGGYYLRDDGIYQLWDDATLTRAIEEPLQGFDTELGIRVPFVSDYVETWVYAGGYHYWGDYIKDVNGFTARLELVPTDFVRLNYEYRHDNIAGGNHYGEVMFEVPFSVENLYAGKNPFAGIGKRLSGSRELPERLVEPTRRDVDVVIKKKSAREYVGDNYYRMQSPLIYVSNDGSDDTGNGLRTNPYRSINKALSMMGWSHFRTTIYVMNVLPDQTFEPFYMGDSNKITIWGSGALNPDYPDLQGYTLTDRPIIDGPSQVRGTNIKIAGFEFRGGEGGIYTTFFGNGSVGLEFYYPNGLEIRDNTFNLTMDRHAVVGIFGYFDGSGYAPVVIRNNEFLIQNTNTDPDSDAGAFGIYLIGMQANWSERPVVISANIQSNVFNIQTYAEGAYTFAAYAADVPRYWQVHGSGGGMGVIGDRNTSRPFKFWANEGTISHAAYFNGPAGMLFISPGIPISGFGQVGDPINNPYITRSQVELGLGDPGIGMNVFNTADFVNCNYGGVYDPMRNPSFYVNP